MKINLYKTQPHDCSYIDGNEASTVFVDPEESVDKSLYSALSARGFRRSGGHIYRPHCSACRQCIATRIPVRKFSRNRNQKRAWQKGAQLDVEIRTSIDSDRCYGIYERYIAERHSDGDMYPAERDQYRDFLSAEWQCTSYAVFVAEGREAGIAVFDQLDDGLSAIYTFFEPEFSHLSIGTLAVLWLVEHAKSLGLNYVYLGYWIRDCAKMQYKSNYRPIEMLIDDNWVLVN